MPETNVNILIGATGGDSANAELQKAVSGFNKIGIAHKDIRDKFSEKFRHIAVHEFGGQALMAAGYAGGMRREIGLLNLAMGSLFKTVGLGTGAMGLMIMASAGVAAAYEKISSGAKKRAEEAAKVSEQNRTEIETNQKVIKSLDDYQGMVGRLSPALEAYRKSLAAINAEKVKDILNTKQQELAEKSRKLAELPAMIDKQTSSLKTLSTVNGKFADSAQTASIFISKSLEKNKKDYEDLKNEVPRLKAEVEALGKGYVTVSDYIAASTEKSKKFNEEMGKASGKRIQQLANETKAGLKAIADGFERSARAIIELDQKLQTAEGAYRAWASRQASNSQYAASVMDNAFNNAYDGMMKGAGDAFAQMAVYGQDFGKGLEDMFKNVLAQFISMVTEMTVRWLAFTALTAWSGPTGAITSFLTNARATGGDDVVDRPTLFLAGERGQAERVNVTPLGAGGAPVTHAFNNSSSSSVSIGSINVTVSGAGKDSASLADEIGRKIIANIRGQGNLAFVR